MSNPFRSEAEAYRFLLLTIGYFTAIVIAVASGGTWPGVVVCVVLALSGLGLLIRRGRTEPPTPIAPRHRGGSGKHRILVVANETVGGRLLQEEVAGRSAGRLTEVLVVSPALNSPLRRWTSDEDGARIAAQARLEQSLAWLLEHGIQARGEIGDGDPLQAIEDALRTFGPDEIVLSTHPKGRSHWLERDVVTRARERFALPITHLVVDLDNAESSDASPSALLRR